MATQQETNRMLNLEDRKKRSFKDNRKEKKARKSQEKVIIRYTK